MTDIPTLATATLAVSAVIAYFLGSLPTAYLAGRLYGKDIFSVGSRQAGATNVFREVSRPAGIAVFLIDSAKGLFAMIAVRMLGLEGVWLLLPASAVIFGHWNSPFTRFRGGDGVSSLTGVVLGIAPLAALIPYTLIGFITLRFNSKLEHPTLWGAIAGYLLYLALTLGGVFPVEPIIVAGVTGLGFAILLHSLTYHRRHVEQSEAHQAALAEADHERKFGNRRS